MIKDNGSKVSSTLSLLGSYEIESMRVSEPACILFAHHTSSNYRVVLKLLFKFQDTRYKLNSVDERQMCQLEALNWNRLFTPNIHIGLAHICHWDRKQALIEIDEIIQNPRMEPLAPNTEYVLLMRQLPTSTRLDNILAAENKASFYRYAQLLTKYIVHIHTNLPGISLSMEDSKKWGNFIQLREKLRHNLEFLDQIMAKSENDEYSTYYWVKDRLLQVFNDFEHHQYFEQRVQEGRIKRCHADLKAPNIWIAPLPQPGTPNEYWYEKEPWKNVYLLDAIDFNPMYSYIDILSDFAMLVIDIQARTKSRELAKQMIEEYLDLTNQQDEVSMLVLGYYLVEKAIIGAAVSILYDNMPDLGLDFLEVANIRMIDLERQVKRQYQLSIVHSSTLSPTPYLMKEIT
jgi:aminoglycoside phosphotransferase family enzyme